MLKLLRSKDTQGLPAAHVLRLRFVGPCPAICRSSARGKWFKRVRVNALGRVIEVTTRAYACGDRHGWRYFALVLERPRCEALESALLRAETEVEVLHNSVWVHASSGNSAGFEWLSFPEEDLPVAFNRTVKQLVFHGTKDAWFASKAISKVQRPHIGPFNHEHLGPCDHRVHRLHHAWHHQDGWYCLIAPPTPVPCAVHEPLFFGYSRNAECAPYGMGSFNGFKMAGQNAFDAHYHPY